MLTVGNPDIVIMSDTKLKLIPAGNPVTVAPVAPSTS